jgi:hypothetical protein
MKHLKLFENFNNIDIDDAKWIVISHLGEVEEIDPKWNAENFLKLELSEEPTKEQILSCEGHLKEEGFFLFIDKDMCIIGVGNSIKEACINWLDENYGDLEKVYSKTEEGAIIYRYEPKQNMIFYKKSTILVAYIHIKIWKFLTNLYLSNEQKKEIIKEWLSKTYNLKVDDVEANVWDYFIKVE